MVGSGTAGSGTIVTSPSTTPSRVGPPRGTPAEQTHPVLLPHTGGQRTRFAVRLTLADAPGHSGSLSSAYRLQLTPPPKRSIRRCAPQTLATITSGIVHQVDRVALSTPGAGWCSGRYTLVVYLQRGPYCPRPMAGVPPTPCPEFAEQDVIVGTAHFTVTKH
jgi:hypothetical protein